MSKPIKQENGVEWLDDGRILLMLCPKCHRENWAPAVVSGQCVWCGYKAEPITDKNDKKKEMDYDRLSLQQSSNMNNCRHEAKSANSKI